MKRIVANLTPLLTCPAFMLWHLLGAVVCIPALLYVWGTPDPADGGYVATFILPAWSAFVVTSLQKDLLHKPFGFVLPGHRDVLRRTSFLVGIATALAASLPVLAVPGLGGLSLLSAVWCAFCFGLMVYLVTMGVQWYGRAFASLGLVTVVVGVLSEFPGARVLVQEVALFAPGWNTVVLVALGVFAWRRLGSVELARRTCGRRFLSLQMLWRRSAGEEFGESGRREALASGSSRARRWLLRRCFDRIGRRPVHSWRRHLAAAQYELSGHLLPLRPWTVAFVALCALVLVVVAGYAPPRETGVPVANDFLFLASCLLGANLWIPVFTTMLLPTGRRERFWTALAFAACGGLVVLAACLLAFILLQGIGEVAPPLSLGGEVYDFRPADLSPALVPLVHLPMSMILKITCKKWLLIPELVLIVIAGVVLVKGGVALRDVSPATAAALLAVSWSLLVGVLFSYSFRRDLVPA